MANFFSPYGLPARLDAGSIAFRIGLMYNEDRDDLSLLEKSSRNTQWSDYSKPELSKLQVGLAEILNRYLIKNKEIIAQDYSYEPPTNSLHNRDKKETKQFAQSVIEALASGRHNSEQVHVESWAVGMLIAKLSDTQKSEIMNEMCDLVQSVSSEHNQSALIVELGTDSYADLTSSVVLSDDLEYGEVMRQQRSAKIVRRQGFVPVPSDY